MEYNRFISYLNTLNSTNEVLSAIYFYFNYFVEYDYDQLQVIKFSRYYENFMFLKIMYYIEKYNTNLIDLSKKDIIDMIDDAFRKTDGTSLSVKNKHNWFNYHDHKINLNLKDYKPIYINDLLRKGVCGEYSVFVKRICDDLSIPCLIAIGKGTTIHAWNLIYDDKQNKWINFDMTMVKFYTDGFTKNFGSPNKWIEASFDEMFSMQPSREIHQIIDGNDILFNYKITKDNVDILNKYLNYHTFIKSLKKEF